MADAHNGRKRSTQGVSKNFIIHLENHYSLTLSNGLNLPVLMKGFSVTKRNVGA